MVCMSLILLGTTTADLIKEFDRRFRDLQKIALEEITEKRIPVTELRQTLMNLPCPITNENKLRFYHIKVFLV